MAYQRPPRAPSAGRKQPPSTPEHGPSAGVVSLTSVGVRLQKVLADAGIASRRHAEQLILDGEVQVDGRTVTQLGTRADPATADIRVHGQRIAIPTAHRYLVLHKPPGYITTASDERGRRTVLDLVGDVHARVYPVGRLDRESEGLLLLTNDGELAARLIHPRHEVEKEYHVLVSPDPGESALERLRAGVLIDGRPTAPALVDPLVAGDRGIWLSITLHEGRKHQIRRMCEAIGVSVLRLVRVRIGSLGLDDLGPGRYRELSAREVARFRALAGIAPAQSRRPATSKQPNP